MRRKITHHCLLSLFQKISNYFTSIYCIYQCMLFHKPITSEIRIHGVTHFTTRHIPQTKVALLLGKKVCLFFQRSFNFGFFPVLFSVPYVQPPKSQYGSKQRSYNSILGIHMAFVHIHAGSMQTAFIYLWFKICHHLFLYIGQCTVALNSASSSFHGIVSATIAYIYRGLRLR